MRASLVVGWAELATRRRHFVDMGKNAYKMAADSISRFLRAARPRAYFPILFVFLNVVNIFIIKPVGFQHLANFSDCFLIDTFKFGV